jgi:hypothetical protein
MMDTVSLLLVLGAAAAIVAVALLAMRRPILWRMGARNAMRRPRQTATVVAGLLIGTAIISAALVASDSAHSAIRGYVYQSLGDIDESVSIQGYPYFPQAAYDAIRTDPGLRSGRTAPTSSSRTPPSSATSPRAAPPSAASTWRARRAPTAAT